MIDKYGIVIRRATEEEIEDGKDIEYGFKFRLVYSQRLFVEKKLIKQLSSIEIDKLLLNLYNKKYNDNKTYLDDNDYFVILKYISDKIEAKGKYVITDKELILDSSNKARRIRKESINNKIVTSAALITGAAIIGAIIYNNVKPGDPDIETTTETSSNNMDDNETQFENETNEYQTNIDNDEFETLSVEYDTNIPIFNTNYDYPSFRSNTEELTNMFENRYNEYGDLFEKYGNQYGIDPVLLCAMSCQENYNKDIRTMPNGGYGLMQVMPNWNSKSLDVFNYFTNKKETIYFNTNDYQSIESNTITRDNAEAGIKAGAAIMQEAIRAVCQSNHNINDKYTPEQCIILAIKYYNSGKNVTDIMRDSSSFDECINNITTIGSGDKNYLKCVFKFIPDGTTLKVYDKNHEERKITIDNTEIDSFIAPSNAKKL